MDLGPEWKLDLQGEEKKCLVKRLGREYILGQSWTVVVGLN